MRTRLDVDSRRDQLIDTGLDLFSEHPYDELSIDEIATAAGARGWIGFVEAASLLWLDHRHMERDDLAELLADALPSH